MPLLLALAVALVSPESDDVVREAEQHFAASNYDEASQAFEKAFELDPDPKYLYARAQAERLAGDCETALGLYERFLETKPPEAQAEPARINRARCEAVLERQQPPPAPEAEPTQDTKTGPDTPPPEPWYRDPWGGGLIGAGTLVTLVGAGVLGSGIAQDRDAADAETEDDFIALKQGARVRHRTGAVLISVGAALVVGGAIRWGLVARRHNRMSAAASLWRHGAGITLRGRF